jgi:sec-independent protein translocase protein TatB
MLPAMFGIGGSEILVILIVALLFLGPDKLPDAAKTISKGIRDLKKQSRALQSQIESDEQIGGAIRDLKSALRGDEYPARPPVRREPPKLEAAHEHEESPPALTGGHDEPRDDGEHGGGEPVAADDQAHANAAPLAEPSPPTVTLPASAGEPDPDSAPVSADELGHLIKPAAGTVAKKHG